MPERVVFGRKYFFQPKEALSAEIKPFGPKLTYLPKGQKGPKGFGDLQHNAFRPKRRKAPFRSISTTESTPHRVQPTGKTFWVDVVTAVPEFCPITNQSNNRHYLPRCGGTLVKQMIFHDSSFKQRLIFISVGVSERRKRTLSAEMGPRNEKRLLH